MTPLIAFALVVAAFAGAFAVALGRRRAALRETRAALRTAAAAAEHGWRLESDEGDGLDDGVAAAALGHDVRNALRGWGPEQVSIRVGRDVQVRFESGQLRSGDIAALAELGSAVARRCRSHAGSAAIV